MANDILTKISNLEQKINSEDIFKEPITVKEWGGADVIIIKELDVKAQKWLDDQPSVISFQNIEPRRRVVVTEYSKELSWLFYQLKHIFSERIDYISKYDFYGLLAQSAMDCLAKNKESKNVKDLLLTVLHTAKGFIDK